MVRCLLICKKITSGKSFKTGSQLSRDREGRTVVLVTWFGILGQNGLRTQGPGLFNMIELDLGLFVKGTILI